MKAAILVNGVPASGKSTVSRALARSLVLPLMTLDTIKEPLFDHIGVGDRDHNRRLGRASYEIIFAALRDWPEPITVVIDAWFGFQPLEVLRRHLDRAGITNTAELWCHAPPAVLAERYAARCEDRAAGHPGLDYVPELMSLAARAGPLSLGPCLPVDTMQELQVQDIVPWVKQALNGRA